MKKKNKLSDWVLFAVVISAILGLAYWTVSTGDSFQVVYASEQKMPGYETSPEAIRVYSSASLIWKTVPVWTKVAGWVCVGLIFVGAWYVGTDRYLPKKKITEYDLKYGQNKGEWKKWAYTFGPVLAAAIFWFAGYSAKNDLGSYVGTLEDFHQEFQVSDAQIVDIRANGGTGALEIKDENGKLTEWFKSNQK